MKNNKPYLDLISAAKKFDNWQNSDTAIELRTAIENAEKQVKNIVNEPMLSVVSLPVKSKVDEIITTEYKTTYGTNYDDNSLESAKQGGLIIANWLLNNR